MVKLRKKKEDHDVVDEHMKHSQEELDIAKNIPTSAENEIKNEQFITGEGVNIGDLAPGETYPVMASGKPGIVIDNDLEKKVKENELIVKKREAEEKLRLAELDTKRMYDSAATLFKNASDYIKHTIIPVHARNESLTPYAYLLEKWLNVIEVWAEGIPMGRRADWDVVDEMLKTIKKDTDKLNLEQMKVKDEKIHKREDELKKINKEISDLNK